MGGHKNEWYMSKSSFIDRQERLRSTEPIFEQLVTMLSAVSIEWLKGTFMAGLKPRIQAKLRLLVLRDLRTLMQMVGFQVQLMLSISSWIKVILY